MDPLAKDLLAWYDADARVLPWRSEPSPYRTWLSEVMLQQTQVDTVIPYFERFLKRFPAVEDLAVAPLDEVLEMWSGLGYYSRARNLHKAAGIVSEKGTFPFDIKGLRSLPGVGEYMAAAIASIAYGQDEATVDGNIARVMARVHADRGPRKGMWTHARQHLPPGRAGDYNQALMDLGARICRPRSPKCPKCPVSSHCEARALGVVDEIPAPKVRKAAPVSQLEAHVFERNGLYLLARRPVEGLWGGLWEFPTIGSAGKHWAKDERRRKWDAAYGVPHQAGPVLFETRHVLSHRIFQYALQRSTGEAPIALGEYTEMRWVQMDPKPSIGLSALTSKGLHALCSQ